MGSWAAFALRCGGDFYLQILLRSRFKCVTFINVCLEASAHSALSIHIHYASRLVCDLVCQEEPRATAAQQIVSVSVNLPDNDL